jgi:hypothetical protein
MQISYKTPLPTLAHRITGFRVPLHSPICSLSLLFSPTKFPTNKIFPTSAVRVCLLSFSEQAQEPWAPGIPAHVIRASGQQTLVHNRIANKWLYNDKLYPRDFSHLLASIHSDLHLECFPIFSPLICGTYGTSDFFDM